MEEFLSIIADALNYRKINRLKGLSKADQIELMDHVLKNSIRGSYALLLFQSRMIQITPYGIGYSSKYSKGDNSNYLTMFPKLEAAYLREIFTSFEMMLFKICHLHYEAMSADYSFESERTISRLKKVRKILGLKDETEFQFFFDEIWFVRDSFAHSFIDLEDICYRGVPLSQCFGTTYTGRSHDEVDFTFVRDLDKIFNPVTEAFISKQFDQIDALKFASLCEAALRPRSLGR